MSPEQEAILAQEVLKNPAYQSAIARVKGQYFSDWADTKWFQFKKREKIWALMRAVIELESEFQFALNEGAIAAKNKPKDDKQSRK